MKEEITGTPDFFEPGKLYSRGSDVLESRDLLDRGADDPHQFRIDVTPEDGAKLGDLERFARKLVEEIEPDLETCLDWWRWIIKRRLPPHRPALFLFPLRQLSGLCS